MLCLLTKFRLLQWCVLSHNYCMYSDGSSCPSVSCLRMLSYPFPLTNSLLSPSSSPSFPFSLSILLFLPFFLSPTSCIGILTLLKFHYPRVVEEPELYDNIRIHAEGGDQNGSERPTFAVSTAWSIHHGWIVIMTPFQLPLTSLFSFIF